MNKKTLSKEELNLKKQYRLNEAERMGITAMIEAGMPLREISRQTGRSVQTIWKLKENAKTPLPQVENIKKRLSGKLYERADEATDLMGDGRLKDMSAYQLAGITKHTVETARLMDDQSTVNIAQIIGHDPTTRSMMLSASRKNSQLSPAQISPNGGDNQRDNNEPSGQE
jgi:hypothetical protein